MRILHVIPSYYPAVRYGGPIRSVHALASASARRGHEVHVYTTNVNGSGVSDVPIGIPVEHDGVRVWYYECPIGRRLFYAPVMGRALRLKVESFNIIHTHSVFLWPTSVAAAAARRFGVPYVVSPRGMLVEDLIRQKNRLAKRAWIGLFERRNVERAAAIHATSETEADAIRMLGFNPRKMMVLPNGVDVPPDVGPSVPLGTSPGRAAVLFLGRINWKKGIDRLILAIAMVPDVELVVAGNDEEKYLPVLVELARAAGVAERIQFLGPVDDVRKWDLLRSARMLVLPSCSENFGNVVLEAMAVGCPVVLTPEVGLAPAVRAVDAGIVAEGAPHMLAAAINMLLGDDGLRRRMGEAGRQTARKDFSWDAIAASMDQVYRDCMSEERKCSAISLL